MVGLRNYSDDSNNGYSSLWCFARMGLWRTTGVWEIVAENEKNKSINVGAVKKQGMKWEEEGFLVKNADKTMEDY